MGLRESLQRAKENATGAAGGVIGSLLSLPQASFSAVEAAVQGHNPVEAAGAIVDIYARKGEKIGRDQADLIFRITTAAMLEHQRNQQRDTNR
jgi:hypothetical protein